MRIPFVDSLLYKQVCSCPTFPEDTDIKVQPLRVITQTKSRSTTVIENFVGKIIAVHNGKRSERLFITRGMVGYKLGCFSYTKKLGRSIHNSEHNRKLKEKQRRKITQRKARKTVVKKTKVSKKVKK